jgi:hypothetical protein
LVEQPAEKARGMSSNAAMARFFMKVAPFPSEMKVKNLFKVYYSYFTVSIRSRVEGPDAPAVE